MKRPDGTIGSADIPSNVIDRLKPFVIPTSDLQPPTSA
jgi:hypothetical protein